MALGRAPARHPEAVSFHPPRAYEAAYLLDVACTGLTAPRAFNAIHWYEVPGLNFKDSLVPDTTERKVALAGEWVGPDTIYVAREWVNTWVPRHEMLHYLTQSGAHDTTVFGRQCHAMWGFLPADSGLSGPGATSAGPGADRPGTGTWGQVK